MKELVPLAPEYRYFTVDFLSNETLAEIPYRGVSYGRAVKGAGEFKGKIPVIPQTASLDLYENTMPGKTALFVVRNNVCVWGGLIWSRQYDVSTRDLSISASEFTSYLYRRFIWKTWNHEFGATFTVSGGTGKIVFNDGSNTVVSTGSTVNIEFYDPSDFQYNGYYRVASTPSPTLDGFSVVGGTAIADIASVEVSAGTATITTNSFHGFSTGDFITVDSGYGAPFDGTFEVTASGGSNTLEFTYAVTSGDIPRTADSGNAVRPVPDGIYTNVTVSVRADTWDYVRNLLDSAFNDFVGTDFPNVYIEPGISYGLNITAKNLDGGFATITTAGAHKLSVGQAVQIQDVGSNFDGEFEVVATPANNQLMYAAGGTLATTTVTPTSAEVAGVALVNNRATIYTTAPHGFTTGNTVNVFAGYNYDMLNGDHEIVSIPTTSSFEYIVSSPISIPYTTFVNATAVVGAESHPVVASKVVSNVATLTLGEPHNFVVGNSVTVANVRRTVNLVRKSLNATGATATVYTEGNHYFTNGSSVTIEGLIDSSHIVKKENTSSTVTMTTEQGHNFAVGDAVTVRAMLDVYPISVKALTANVATLTTPYPHNIPNGTVFTVESLVDDYTVTNKVLSNNTVTLTTSINHNFVANSKVTVTGIVDTGTVISKTAENGVGILTLSAPHNFREAEEVTISGVGAPFDGTFTLLAATETRIFFEVKNDNNVILPAASGGTVVGADSIFNGTFTLTAATANTISYSQVGQDIGSQAASGLASGLSVLNGIRTTTAVTGTTLQFALAANNIPSAAVPVADEDGEIQAVVCMNSVHSGARTLTAITRNTFTFAQSGLTADPVPRDVDGSAVLPSIFNGAKTLTEVTDDTFKFTLAGISNVIEEDNTYLATATSSTIFNGVFIITAADPVNRTISYSLAYQNIPNTPVQSRGLAVVRPTAIISSFGPFPGNADFGLTYSTRQYSGKNVEPVAYRGFELTNIGEALDQYSDSINGFEYRIDCAFDPDTESFTKTFVLLPIDFPNPPLPGEVSDISRFGADKLVFEYPGGSITSLGLSESADESSTRFFATGETDLGPDVGPNVSIASATDLLSGENSERRWPLLDDSEKIDDVDDEVDLYSYAQRYLTENRPPNAAFSVSVNGSIAPLVGTYAPGDWCSLIIDDPFIQMRLQSKLEPRDDVIVRKIESYTVSVPDSVTFPEKVTLNLVAEWEVDKRG
jgi:hypothetical protein